MSVTISKKGANKKQEQYNKIHSIESRQYKIAHIEEVDKLGLMLELMNPCMKSKYTRRNQQNNILKNWQNNNWYQSLHIDPTSYETLKQLIVQNKSLVKQSQSAYFLSKQAHKLITFIDGYRRIGVGEQIDESAIDQEWAERRRSRENRKNKEYEIIEEQDLMREEEQRKVQNNKRRQVRKLSQKPALIIEQEEEKQQYLIEGQEKSSNQYEKQEQIQVEIELQQDQLRVDENNMNRSNIISSGKIGDKEKGKLVRQNREDKVFNKQNNNNNNKNSNKNHNNNKIILLYSSNYNNHNNNNNYNNNKIILLYSSNNNNHNNNNNYNNKDSNKQHHDNNNSEQENCYKNSNRNNNNNNQQIADLSQIIRPEYQKTQVSLQSSSSLDNSTQNQHPTIEHISSESLGVVPPTINRKKTIPLLKMKKSSHKYNQLIHASKLTTQARITIKDKGFISQDTDANSRLSTFTNKPIVNLYNTQQNQPSHKRSLSPKLQRPNHKLQNNKKKVMIKRNNSSNNHENLLNCQLQQTSTKYYNNTTQPYQSKIQLTQLNELQDQFMNRNVNNNDKDEIKYSQPQQMKNKNSSNKRNTPTDNNNTHYQHDDQAKTTIYHPTSQQSQISQAYHEQQQLFTKKIPKQNKTLKLIKKPSQSLASNNQLVPNTQSRRSNTNNYKIQAKRQHHQQQGHFPLTNNSNNSLRKPTINMQKNSIVLEEQPWECDQLQLQEQLKALDEKIQGRKSMLNANHQYNKQHYQQISHGQYGQQQDHLYYNHQDKFNNPIHHTNKPSHTRFNSTQQLSTNPYQKHKRSNTSSNLPQQNPSHHTFNQHLFSNHQQLFIPPKNIPEKNIPQQNGHHQYQQQPHSQQPKVVRLSLTALASNASKKSRQSLNGRHASDRRTLNSHNNNRNQQLKQQTESLLNRQHSAHKLGKQPSCKSILLYEQAEKRGISPTKSSKSLKIINNNNNSRSNNNNRNNNSNNTTTNNKNITTKNTNDKSKSPIKQYTSTNIPPNITNNNFHPTNNHPITPKNHRIAAQSRTLSDNTDISQNSIPKMYMNANQFIMANHNQTNDFAQVNKLNKSNKMMIHRHDQNHNTMNLAHGNRSYGNNDLSLYSNCQSYFNPYNDKQQHSQEYVQHTPQRIYQQQYHQQQYHHQHQKQYQLQNNSSYYQQEIPSKKWNTKQAKQFQQKITNKKNKMVLLSDQLNDC